VSAEPSIPRTSISPSTAYALAVTCMVIWGSPPVVTRAVSGDIPPLALAFARWLIALAVLLPLVWRKLRAEWPLLRRHWRPLTGVSTCMVAGSTLSVLAVYFTTATNAVLVNASQPAITAVIAWAVAGTRLTRRQSVGIACAFVGIAVMIFRASPAAIASLDFNIGDLIMLGAVVGWAAYAVLLHRRDHLPSNETMMFVIATTGSVVLLPVYVVELAIIGPFALDTHVAGAMVYLALFPTLLATFFWNMALGTLGANRTAIFINLIPVFGALFAMSFLGERLFVYHLLGAAFVFCGIYLAARHAGR
jgi:drug/metabolite transporter (DMT)-like permease